MCSPWMWLIHIITHSHIPKSNGKDGDNCLAARFLSCNYQSPPPPDSINCPILASGAARCPSSFPASPHWLVSSPCEVRCKAVAPLRSFLSASFAVYNLYQGCQGLALVSYRVFKLNIWLAGKNRFVRLLNRLLFLARWLISHLSVFWWTSSALSGLLFSPHILCYCDIFIWSLAIIMCYEGCNHIGELEMNDQTVK